MSDMSNARLGEVTAAQPFTAEELAQFNAWKASQLQSEGLITSAPAPATVAAPAPSAPPSVAPSSGAGATFKVGQIVDTPQGIAVIISITSTARIVQTVDTSGTVTGQNEVQVPAYRIAYLPAVTDSHSTEQELGLKAL